MVITENQLDEVQSLMVDMLMDVEGIRAIAHYIEGELFSRISPQTAYTDNFQQLQAMYHMMLRALYKFEGELSLLSGYDGTVYHECTIQRVDKLKKINESWNIHNKEREAV